MAFKKIFTFTAAIAFLLSTSTLASAENKPTTKVLYLKTSESPQINLFLANTKNILDKANKNPIFTELDLNNKFLKIPSVLDDTMTKIKTQEIDMIFSLNFAPAIRISKYFPDTPMICAMITEDDAQFLKLANNKTTGVATKIFLREKFAFLKKIAPQSKKIGLIYKEQKYNKPLLNAKTAARENNLELFLIKANTQAEMLDTINRNIAQLDAITLLVGSDLIYPTELIKYISTICAENNKIFIGWEPSHVREGALFSIYPDIKSMSTKCGKIMKRIQDAESPTAIDFEINSNFFLSYNLSMGKQLDLNVSNEILAEIDVLSE